MEGDDQTEVTIEPGDLDGWVKITGLEIDVGDAGSWDEPSTKQKSKPRARPRQTQNFEVEDDDNGVAEWGEVAPVASPSEASVTTPTTKGEPEMNPADQEAFDWGDQANSQSVDTAAVDVSATYNAPKLQGGELTGKPGDWECPACQYVNFGSRGECRQCKRWRADFPSGSVRVVPGDVPEGGFSADWACDECGFLNFASRQECRECDSPRPQVAAGGGNLVLGEAATSELGGTKTGGATATSIAGRLGVRPRGSAAAARTSSRGTGSAWSADSRTSPLARSVASASVRVLPGQGDAPRRSNRAWWGTGTVLSADSTTSPPATTAESAPNQGPQEPARLKKVGTGAALNVGLSILDLATSAVTAC
eukprot:CAMPEP_0114228364 /NCGR_PEP_ID=MMETSP0058-20121206/2299_1 /TAXON_ID=36894 /ORGANISM="Pyramimonas parkeae, CCMP726" /LENGTH=364 /DNA_ID=CAMNT_0001339297 /DNA_START=416 /DNA_END=1511 /DNA_ORIENTATION=+